MVRRTVVVERAVLEESWVGDGRAGQALEEPGVPFPNIEET